MEKNLLPQLEIADYRRFLTGCDRCRIRIVEATGSDVASILPALRDKMARIDRPDAVLLSVCVPSAENIASEDPVSLLRCVTGDNDSLNVFWNVKELPSRTNVSVTVYVRQKSPRETHGERRHELHENRAD